MKRHANWKADLESDAFWRQLLFKWNGAFWKNGVVSCISLEKKERERSKRCCFERHHKSSSSPGCTENKGKRSICSLVFPPHSLSQTQKQTRQSPPTYMKPGIAHTPHDEGWIEEPCGGLRRLHRGTSATLPCLQDGTEAG